MNFFVDIQNALEPEPQGIPSEEKIIEWVSFVLNDAGESVLDESEMTVRLVHEAEITELNQNYRQKDGPTNVLSFPADIPDEVELPLLGDVIICAEIVENEAQSQNKSLESHWAHMVVHGTLHLLGYDHIEESDAVEMETKEIEILANFGYSNPYNAHSLENLVKEKI